MKEFYKVDDHFDNLVEIIQNTTLLNVDLLLDQHFKEHDNSGKFLRALHVALHKIAPSPKGLGPAGFIGEDNQINRAYLWMHRKYDKRAREAFQKNNDGLLTKSLLTQKETFVNLLTPAGRKILQPLIDNYKGCKPIEFAYMVFALKDLSLLAIKPVEFQTKTFKAIQNTFGKAGSPQNFRQHIKNMHAGVYDVIKMNSHKAKIKAILKK